MNIWFAREKSFDWLNNELKSEAELLREGFDYLESFVSLFEKIGENEGENEVGQFSRIGSVTLAKFSHLLIGCYSLTLDGLAQESGALIRPLIETYELLVYFRQDKTRINQVLNGKLPSAGNIGKRISGDYKDLRAHLSKNASHFSYGIDSIRHLFDNNNKIKPVPNHSLDVLYTNLQLLNAFQIFILIEAVKCLLAVEFDANTLADEIEKWRDLCIKTFSSKNR